MYQSTHSTVHEGTVLAGKSVGGSRDPQVHLDSHIYQQEEEERQETSANKKLSEMVRDINRLNLN